MLKELAEGKLPVLLATAIVVVLTSAGPPTFKQQRVGRSGRPFGFYKFRSMRVSAGQELQQPVDLNQGTGPIFVDHTGRQAFRKSSIDELPTLWNVLRGDVTAVGPHPPLPDEVE